MANLLKKIGGLPVIALVLLAIYPLVAFLCALHAAITRRRGAAVGWLLAALMTEHVAWSAGFWASLLPAFGRTKEKVGA